MQNYPIATVFMTEHVYKVLGYEFRNQWELKVRSGFKLPPIGCTVRERASYMCSLANVCHFVAGRSLFYVKKD